MKDEETAMIPWKPYAQLPEFNRRIVTLDTHWKNVWPMSIEIRGWEYVNRDNNGNPYLVNIDDSGQGCLTVNFDGEEFQYWCYAEEFEAVRPKTPHPIYEFNERNCWR